jgi:glycosyltransferase involved in cell wall biosynthesis
VSPGFGSPGAPPWGRRVLVVVPAHNEAATVADVVRRVRAIGLECVVIDDASSDDTAVRAAAAGARALRLPVNLGVGGALRTGFRYAVERGYDTVVQCDGDGQHPPEEIPDLLAAADAADLVIGSRFLPGAESFTIGRNRRLAMHWLSWLVRRRGGIAVADTTSGFRCISQPLLGEFARDFPTHYLGDTFEALIVAARAGYTIAEVPTRIEARAVGRSTAGALAAMTFTLRATVVVLLGNTARVRRKADVGVPAVPQPMRSPSPEAS